MDIVFETPRLFLRKFAINDAPLILQLNSNSDIVRFVHEPVLETLSQTEKILEEIILPQYDLNMGRWAIHKKADGNFIGWCGLKLIQKSGINDLGYRLLKTEWGKGFATEAARETIHYGFTALKLPLITGKALPENVASINVLEKIGMEFKGIDLSDGFPVKVYEILSPESSRYC
jgi:RimJ/RimL family protein N-acetyltransferase